MRNIFAFSFLLLLGTTFRPIAAGSGELPAKAVEAMDICREALRQVECPGGNPSIGTPCRFLHPLNQVPVRFNFFPMLFSITKDEVLQTLVPKFGKIYETADRFVELEFQPGWTVRFFFSADHFNMRGLEIRQTPSYLAQHGAQHPIQVLEDIFTKAGVLDRWMYSRKNPDFALEQQADRLLRQPTKKPFPPRIDIQEVPKIRSISDSTLILVPDHHGKASSFNDFRALLQDPLTDWVALEMFHSGLQPDINIFLNAERDSQKFRDSKKRIEDYLRVAWDGYWKQEWTNSGPDCHEGNCLFPLQMRVSHSRKISPYMELLEDARRLHKKVVALDPLLDHWRMHLSTLFSVSSRNAFWESRTPAKGHGVVFGGAAHFILGLGADFQAHRFLAQPSARVFIFLSEATADGLHRHMSETGSLKDLLNLPPSAR